MPIQPLARYASRRMTRRLTRELPIVGGIIVILMVGSAIRRKGLVGGTLHTTLDFIPFVGLLKNVAEWVRGRDLFPDKPTSMAPPAGR